jgi:hypothetical protein
MKGTDREFAILTIERLMNHLKKQGAATPGTSPFSPAEAFALLRGLRLIKKTLFPSDPHIPLDDEEDEPPKHPADAP